MDRKAGRGETETQAHAPADSGAMYRAPGLGFSIADSRHQDRADRVISALVDRTVSTGSRAAFHTAALDILRELVGFESAAVVLPGSTPVTLHKDAETTRVFVANRTRYVVELMPVAQAAYAHGGVALDTAVLSAAQRDRLTMYRQVVRPQGIRSTVFSYLSLGGFTSAVISLARHGAREFKDRDLQLLRRLVPVLALGDEYHRRGPPTRSAGGADWSLLSARECEVVDYVCLGLTNTQIGLACAVSANTVRNHLARIFRKLDVSSRSELVRLATCAEPGRLPAR